MNLNFNISTNVPLKLQSIEYYLPLQGMFDLKDLVFIRKVGVGAFGKVYLVSADKNKPILFAAKMLNKKKLLLMRQADQVENEINALKELNGHVFITKLVSVVQDTKRLGLILDYISGGELFFWLRTYGKFTEYATLFYAAEILVALEYIHLKGFLYRDLKPENILLTQTGHVKLTDFGFAIKDTEKTHIISGTPEYMSPEKLLNEDDGSESDFWSFGVILYEMMTGEPPFYANDSNSIYRKILEKNFLIPPFLSFLATDILQKLLHKKRQERLGYWGFDDIKRHPFFARIKWNEVDKLLLVPPIIPDQFKNLEQRSFEESGGEDDFEYTPPTKPYGYLKQFK